MLAVVTAFCACGRDAASENLGVAAQALTTNDPFVEGYADKTSVVPGASINFYFNTPPLDSGNYTMQIVRYGRSHACTDSGFSCGDPYPTPQTWDDLTPISISVPTVQRSWGATSGRDGAGWDPTSPIQFTVPNHFTSGIYAAHVCSSDCTDYPTSTNPVASPYALFIVKAATAAPIVMVASTHTWAAYNLWPYDTGETAATTWYRWLGCQTDFPNVVFNQASGSGTTVSFLRPNPNAAPYSSNIVEDGNGHCYLRSEHLALGNIRILQWLEREGHQNYSVISDSDLDLNDGYLSPATSPTVILPTHSEYWTPGMHTALGTYLAAGGNVLSLSGDTMEHVSHNSASQLVKGLINGASDAFGTNEVNWGPEEDGSWQIDPNVGVREAASAKLLGVLWQEGASLPSGVTCEAYSSLAPTNHWSLSGVATPTTPGSAVAASGVTTATSQFCGGNGTGVPPVGWEVDTLAATTPTLPSQTGSPPFSLTRMFSHIATSATSGPPSSSVDGPADIVFAQRASAGASFSVGSIMFGQALLADSFLSSGQQLTPMINNVLARFSHPTLSDFNGDGFPDILAHRTDNNWLTLYSGTSAGGINSTYAAVVNPTTGGYSWTGFDTYVSVGDFDGDGHSDIIARSSGNLSLFCGNGDGSFCSSTKCYAKRCTNATPAPVVNSGWAHMLNFAGVGDFDGDGNSDLLAVRDGTWAQYPGSLWLFRGDGAGGFINGGIMLNSASTWPNFTLIPIGDFNGDGNVDLIVRSGTYLYLYVGNGGVPRNADGSPNPVLTYASGNPFNSGWSSVAFFIPMGNLAGIDPAIAGPDLLIPSSTGSLLMYKGNRTGNFQSGNSTIANSSGWTSAAFDWVLGVW